MKKFAEQLKKRSEQIRMTTDEKSQLRERVLSFMEYHPLPHGQVVDLRELAKAKSQTIPVWNAWLIGRFAGGFAVLLMVVVPALAENALPGEALYPVKVRFNEEVRGALNSSPYERIEWETERMERRLAEAQVLADAGRLTPEAEAEMADAIREHSLAAKTSIETIRANDNDEAVMAEIALSSALEVSAEVLTNQENAKADPGDPSLLSVAVKEARASLDVDNSHLSYDKLLSRIEAETTKAHEYLNTLSASISAEEKTDIDRRLTDIKIRVESAAALKESDEASAAQELAEALKNTRKLISFMTNLEVRRNVTVDELVPITPTEEEEREMLEVKLNDASKIVAAVKSATAGMATSSNDYLAITDTLEQFQTLEAEARASLEDDDLPTAEVSIGLLLELSQALSDTLSGLGFTIETE